MTQKRIQIDPVDLRRLYIDQLLTTEQVAAIYGCSAALIGKRLHKHKIPVRGSRSGENHWCWKGGVTVEKSGYVLRFQPDHPQCNSNGYIRESRLVMEQTLGRYLLPTEVVHHKDGNKANNNPSNLELFQSNADHLTAELSGRCPKWSVGGLRRIRDSRTISVDSKRLVEMYRSGEKMRDIAAAIGVSVDCVRDKLKSLGEFPRQRPHRSKYKWPSDDELKAMYATRSLNEIAAAVGCTAQLVHWRLSRLGVQMRSVGARGLLELRKHLGSTPNDHNLSARDEQE